MTSVFRRPRGIRLVASFALVAALLPAAAAPVSADTGATVLPGFRDELLWGGLQLPTAVATSPDGSRIFVAEKRGTIQRFDGLTDSTATQVADLSSQVYDYWDRGLLGLTVDPDFPTRPYLYALYTYDSVPWNDACPSPPGPTTNGCLAGGRLARLTIGGGGAGTVTSQTNLITDWCQQFPSHSVGTVAFGPDGALYVSGGDGASFSHARDSGQLGSSTPGAPTPVNPCNDPPSQGGALRAQDIRTSADPTGLAGTVIRVNPDTGAAWPTNDNAGLADTNARKIIGYGLRNPFRFTFDQGGAVWIGDVGFGVWEEINEIADADAAAPNFGWPCYEGLDQQTSYWNPASNPAYDPALCTSLAGQTAPQHRYSHSATVVSGDGCGTGSSAIAGLTFLRNDTTYPNAYDGALFWTDYNRKCIWYAPRGSNGRPDFSARARFADLRRSDDPANMGGVATFLGTTSDGDILYTSFDRGEVRAIRFYPPNAPPSASFTVTPASGTAPLDVDLDASGSTDSNGDPLTYAWDLDADGQYDDATGVTTSTTLNTPGNITIGLRVTDDGAPALSDTASKVVQVGNAPPVITFSAPSASLTWAVGDQIAYGATASDPQDGTLPASAFHWEWSIAHCRPSECHEHVIQSIDDVRNGTFPAPDHQYPSFLRVTVTVTDSDGLEASVTREIHPKTGTVNATSVPAGIALGYYDENVRLALPATGIVGSTIVLDAPPSATIGEGTYAFQRWSDGSTSAAHTVPVTTGAKNLTATYTLRSTSDAPNSCNAARVERRAAAWRSGRLGSGSDVDWYRFTMASKGTIRLLLGDLPVGASLTLYKGCSEELAFQNRSGTAAEEIVRLLSTGTYAVKVAATGAASSSPYALQILRLPPNTSVQSSSSHAIGGQLHVVGEVWNESTNARGPITVTVKYLNASGVVLATTTGETEVMAPGRNRAPFRVSRSLPAGFASVRVSVSSVPASKTVVPLTVSGTTSTFVGGRWRVQGTVTAPSAVHTVRVVMVQYDDRGRVIDVTRATLGIAPRTQMGSAESTTFDAWSTYTGGAPDRVRIVAIGLRN